jgi:hypothetical protein
MAQQSTSPYGLDQVLRVAQHRVVLVAQNHRNMTSALDGSGEKFWPIMKEKIENGVSIDIVAMHDQVGAAGVAAKDLPNAYELWARYMNNSQEFASHAKDCWATLESWHMRYRGMSTQQGRGGRLRIFGAYFLPVSMSFVDPDSEHGFLVLSPRMGHEASQHRPHFVIRGRSESRAFEYYWGTIRNGFDNAGWREMFIGQA